MSKQHNKVLIEINGNLAMDAKTLLLNAVCDTVDRLKLPGTHIPLCKITIDLYDPPKCFGAGKRKYGQE